MFHLKSDGTALKPPLMPQTPGDVHTDCRNYSGYKPCGKSEQCPDCAHYAPRGTEILIIKLGAMGDVLRTKALLSGLKAAHPTSSITWVTNPGSAEIVKDARVDRVLELHPLIHLELAAKHFDLLISLDKEPVALGLSASIPAARKFGYAPTPSGTVGIWNAASEYAWRLGLSDELKYRHNRKTHLQLLYEMAELPYNGEEYELAVSPAEIDAVTHLIAHSGLNATAPRLGINTGCGEAFQTKAWTPEGFAASIERLLETTPYSILLLGGPREKEINSALAERYQKSHPGRFFDTGTENTLPRFFAWVNACDVLLSSDSLAMHVGIALKKRVVAFFGPTCEQEIDLFGRGEKWVTTYACSPCYLKTCTVRPSCMQAMPAEEICAALERQLPLVGVR